jgi:hypothetical protein
LLGVVEPGADGSRVAYLNEQVPVTDELLSQTGSVPPTQVFRLAANCEERRCTHFDGQRCNLVSRIVAILPPVVDDLPVCLIRSSCRWYEQEGRSACLRCPQVVTELSDPTDDLKRAAQPDVSPQRQS